MKVGFGPMNPDKSIIWTPANDSEKKQTVSWSIMKCDMETTGHGKSACSITTKRFKTSDLKVY